jgi:amino acid permease
MRDDVASPSTALLPPTRRGVFTFLRMGWMTGQVGFWGATLNLVIATTLTMLTGISMSALCTNGQVKGGGIYYMVSRQLGPSIGAALGLTYFTSLSVGTAMHIAGFTESLILMYSTEIARRGGKILYFTGSRINDSRVLGFITNIILVAVAFVGIGWYAKTQTMLLVFLSAALLAVWIGAFVLNVPPGEGDAESGFVGMGHVSYEDATSAPWGTTTPPARR